MSLRNTPNQYWGHAAPPPDCCMSVVCSAFNRNQFRDYVKMLADAGIYYSHNVHTRTVTLAFSNPIERALQECILKEEARRANALIETI